MVYYVLAISFANALFETMHIYIPPLASNLNMKPYILFGFSLCRLSIIIPCSLPCNDRTHKELVHIR